MILPELVAVYKPLDTCLATVDPSIFGPLCAASVFLFAYFLPTLIAWDRGHRSGFAIFLFNLLFGWTVLGWVVALIWSGSGGDSNSDPSGGTGKRPFRPTPPISHPSHPFHSSRHAPRHHRPFGR